VAATVKYAIVVAACLLGTLSAFGCGIAALLELDGFGRREGGPNALYVAALFAGLAASIATPVVLWRLLLPETAPPAAVGIAVFVAAFVLVLAIAGVN
jgi:hypothetical protein